MFTQTFGGLMWYCKENKNGTPKRLQKKKKSQGT